MTPAPALIALTWIGSIVASYFLGKYKGHVSAGIILTVILGPLGLLILACLPRTRAAKTASAQRLYGSAPEAVRRAGYAYPPQSPTWLRTRSRTRPNLRPAGGSSPRRRDHGSPRRPLPAGNHGRDRSHNA